MGREHRETSGGERELKIRRGQATHVSVEEKRELYLVSLPNETLTARWPGQTRTHTEEIHVRTRAITRPETS